MKTKNGKMKQEYIEKTRLMSAIILFFITHSIIAEILGMVDMKDYSDSSGIMKILIGIFLVTFTVLVSSCFYLHKTNKGRKKTGKKTRKKWFPKKGKDSDNNRFRSREEKKEPIKNGSITNFVG